MKKTMSFDELVKKVQQQEDTVTQLVKIIAATNHRVTDLINKHNQMENANTIK